MVSMRNKKNNHSIIIKYSLLSRAPHGIMPNITSNLVVPTNSFEDARVRSKDHRHLAEK